jgi:hypothetical protein
MEDQENLEDIDIGHFQRTSEQVDDPRIGEPGEVVKIAGPWIRIKYDDPELGERWWHESWLHHATED